MEATKGVPAPPHPSILDEDSLGCRATKPRGRLDLRRHVLVSMDLRTGAFLEYSSGSGPTHDYHNVLESEPVTDRSHYSCT